MAFIQKFHIAKDPDNDIGVTEAGQDQPLSQGQIFNPFLFWEQCSLFFSLSHGSNIIRKGCTIPNY